jgi:hypothetical protein
MESKDFLALAMPPAHEIDGIRAPWQDNKHLFILR